MGKTTEFDAASYLEVDEAAAATLGRGGGTPTGPAGAAPALPPLPDLNIPAVSPPVVTGIPGDGKAIAELIHTGGGNTEGLRSAATWLREHSTELHSSGTALHSIAGDLENEWASEAGGNATARIRELGTWYSAHAEHASVAASAG